MNKGLNIAARQRQHNASLSLTRKKEEEAPPFYTYNGFRRYSYKGIVIEKRDGMYQIGKRIAISGFPVASVGGKWTDGKKLKNAIDYGLTLASPERHAEVMKSVRNWKCPECETVALVESKNMRNKVAYKRDSSGEEVEVDTGEKLLSCDHCSLEMALPDVPYTTNDTFF